MLAVIICNLFSIMTLLGLLAGMTVGFFSAGRTLVEALEFEPFTPKSAARLA